MDPGVNLIPSHGFMIPNYLTIKAVRTITLEDHIDPTALPPSTALIYKDNLYLSDEFGNIAFIDYKLKHTTQRNRYGLHIPNKKSKGEYQGRRPFWIVPWTTSKYSDGTGSIYEPLGDMAEV